MSYLLSSLPHGAVSSLTMDTHTHTCTISINGSSIKVAILLGLLFCHAAYASWWRVSPSLLPHAKPVIHPESYRSWLKVSECAFGGEGGGAENKNNNTNLWFCWVSQIHFVQDKQFGSSSEHEFEIGIATREWDMGMGVKEMHWNVILKLWNKLRYVRSTIMWGYSCIMNFNDTITELQSSCDISWSWFNIVPQQRKNNWNVKSGMQVHCNVYYKRWYIPLAMCPGNQLASGRLEKENRFLNPFITFSINSCM